MTYLLFDEQGEFVDALKFETEDELDSFKISNPTITVKAEDDFEEQEDEYFEYDEDEIDEW